MQPLKSFQVEDVWIMINAVLFGLKWVNADVVLLGLEWVNAVIIQIICCLFAPNLVDSAVCIRYKAQP